MNLKTVLTGNAFALVRYGSGSAWLMKNKVSRRSAWLTEADALEFYASLGRCADATVDNLLSLLWNDGSYAASSFSDAVA